jgi:arsenate reductase
MHKTIDKKTEITLYYNPGCSKAKKAIAYAHSIANSVFAVEYRSSARTGTIWENVLKQLKLTPKELMDKSKPYYQQNIRGRDFDERDWLSVLMMNPDLIRSPIAIRGNKAMILDNPTDIYKL